LLHNINICHVQQSAMGKAESEAYARRFGFSDSTKKRLKEHNDSLEKLIIPHEYKIIEKGSDIFLVFTRDNKILYSFKVSDIQLYKTSEFGENSYEITLVRHNISVTKKQLLEVINLTSNQRMNLNTNPSENGLYGQWYTNNNENAFLMIDTVRLYNSKNIMDDRVYYCEFKILEFSKRNKFLQYSYNKCGDPQMTQAETDARNNDLMGKDWKKKFDKLLRSYLPDQYKIIEKDSDIFLVIFKVNKVSYSFKLDDISNYNTEKLGKDSYVITFIRKR
jgi:hypothetical protein